MAVEAKVRKQTLKFGGEEKELYIVSADRGSVIDTDKIADTIEQNTGVKKAQVKMVMESLVENIMTWAEEGHGVRLGTLGTMLPSVKSNSSESADEVSVKKVRLTFRGSKTLRERLNNVSTSTVNAYKSAEAGADGDGAKAETPSAGGSGDDDEFIDPTA
jgi:predicted histone-like DNA-binding protein